MQLYESYKPSGAVWLGNVPSHWDVQPLRAVTSLKSDKNRPDMPVLSVYREYGVILKDSRDDNHNATSLDTSTYKVVKPGDLVVNKMKAWQGSMGVSSHHGIVSPAYITCTTKADLVRPAYLHYLLRSSPLIGVYNSLSYGVRVGQWDMHYEDFKQIPIPLPPKDEQDRIVAFLDQKTAEINAAIAKKERLIELLEEEKLALVNEAVTYGLNRAVSFKHSGIEWIEKIPSHWVIRKISHLFRLIGSGTTPASGNPAYYENGESDWINTGDLNDGVIDGEVKKVSNLALKTYSSLKAYPEGTLIVAMYGATIGKTGITSRRATVNQACCCLHGAEKISTRYAQLWFYGNKNNIVAMGYGGGQPNISQDLIRSLRIPTPPLPEQAAIVEFVDAQTQIIDQLMQSTRIGLIQLYQLKQTLIASMVTGKFNVSGRE